MKGKSYSIPTGMVFRKYYCSKCGARLEKEKTHRVVTKDDKDYYQYQDYRKFPRRDYDVYGYRFKCPSCNERISFDEQSIIEKIQKKHKRKVLSRFELASEREKIRDENNKKSFLGVILFSVIFSTIFFALFFFFRTQKTTNDLFKVAILYFLFTAFSVWQTVRRYKGKGKLKTNRSYSYEHEAKMERLHTYSANNKELIERSDKCYCFCCKNVFDSSEVVSYFEDEQTAFCPKCNIDSVIPDSINETVDENVISEMHEYWF